MTLYLGLMSGTSMDGVDAALIDLPEQKLIGGLTKAYSSEVQQRLRRLLEQQSTSLDEFCVLNALIAEDFAQAALDLLQQTAVDKSAIKAIGSHGQTICHNTTAIRPYTLQIGCPHRISSLTGITVVADFRTRDLVNGGQGAPFAPLYHQQLFAKRNETIAVVNIGGIANISVLTSLSEVRGWDLGPGNCLLDAWVYKHLQQTFDKDGAWAAQGKVIPTLLERLLSDAFLNLKPPKSIGKEYYSLSWLEHFISKDYQPVDVQATLVDYTAFCIANSINNETKVLYLCGGGAHNKELHKRLAAILPGVSVQSSASVGIHPDYLEAMMFAWLASKTMALEPLDLASITGSNKQEILGAVYPF